MATRWTGGDEVQRVGPAVAQWPQRAQRGSNHPLASGWLTLRWFDHVVDSYAGCSGLAAGSLTLRLLHTPHGAGDWHAALRRLQDQHHQSLVCAFPSFSSRMCVCVCVCVCVSLLLLCLVCLCLPVPRVCFYASCVRMRLCIVRASMPLRTRLYVLHFSTYVFVPRVCFHVSCVSVGFPLPRVCLGASPRLRPLSGTSPLLVLLPH